MRRAGSKLLLVALIVLLSTASCDTDTGKRYKLKVITAAYLSWAPLFIADAEGLFQKHGLDVEFIRMAGNTDALPALVQGRVDVVPGYISPGFLNLMARGADLRFVADKGHIAREGCSYRVILARRPLVESGQLDSLSGIRGLRLAGIRTSSSYYDIDLLLDRAGLTSDDVEFVDVPPPAKPEAFATGAIDIATATEPWVTRILDGGHAVVWMEGRELIPDYQHSFLLFGPNLLRKNREAGIRFLTAYLEALRQYNEGKTERNVEILVEHTGLSRDFLLRACWTPVRENGLMNVESIIRFQEWAFGAGLLDTVIPVERFWDPTLIEEARTRLHSVD